MEQRCHKDNDNPPIKFLRSAGGIIFRRKAKNIFEVALIAVKNRSVWTLPKGIIDEGEQTEEAALREVREETGLTGRIVDVIGDKTYWFYNKDENVKYMKTVSYFLMEYVSGDMKDYDWEIDDAKWFDIDEALKAVSYKSDKETLQKAKEKLQHFLIS